ncbi:MAG: vWA domain-containing protein [Pseudoclavibacter sp.]|nr:vWA domain-containing protein [Pseudoclavibacter sp.]
MTWNPVFPLAVVLLIGVLLLAVTIAGLLRARTRPGRLGWICRIAVAVLLTLACLRPGIGSTRAPVVESEADVVFVVDTTASMVAEDWSGEPRLEGVREDVMALAQHHTGARFALITFDRSVQQRLPLTSDATALQSVVTTLRPEITRHSGGSSVTAAAEELRSVLRRAEENDPGRARIVYYLGDGEQTSDDPLDSMRGAAPHITAGAVLGYGTSEGGPMRETLGGFATGQPGYIQDPGGGDAISRIDEGNLQTIAGELGLAYQHRTPDAPVQAAQFDAPAPTGASETDVERSFELYWILAIAVFLLLLREAWVLTRGIMELRTARGERT